MKTSLKRALFLSSHSAAFYDIIDNNIKEYRIRAWVTEEEYKPLLPVSLAPGPFIRNVYHVSVSRWDGDTLQPPHTEYAFYEEHEIVIFLGKRKINICAYWTPEEEGINV